MVSRLRALVGMLVALALLVPMTASAVVAGTLADPDTGDHVVALIRADAPDTRSGQFCTGSLVDAQWVLTAAHCTDGLAPGQFDVAAGQTYLGAIRNADHYQVDAVAQYPLYSRRKWGHDLALVHLATPVPASIHPAHERYQRGPRATYATRAWVSGWGATENAPDGSQILLTGEVTTTTPAQCKAMGAPWGTICGTLPFSAEASACWGDSGGPLESGGILIGIVSFGPEGCDNSAPTAYTHVGTYSTWIDWVRRGGDPRTSLPEVTLLRARQLPGSRAVALTMRWCQSGALGHRIVADFRVAYPNGRWHLHDARTLTMRSRCATHSLVHEREHGPGIWTAFAEVEDRTTGMRYYSTYPYRFRVR